MNIVVCVKQTPDTETKVKIGADGKSLNEDGVNFILNPYDEFAIEEAIRIKEKLSAGEITVISVGPERAKSAITTSLAMGGDKAVHLSDALFNGSDSLGIAKALAKVISGIPYDLILCGHKAIDDDAVQVGGLLAELLNIPQAYIVTKIELSADNKSVICHKQVEGGTQVVEMPLPALATCQKGINEPRYPTLPNIMKAKKKEVKIMTAAELGITDAVGSANAKVIIEQMTLPAERTAGKPLEGEPEDTAKQLINLLHTEAKVI